MAAFEEPRVAAVFDSYPPAVRAKLLAIRKLIFDTARRTEGVGSLTETLKWGQPSYLTVETKSGSTIRVDKIKGSDRRCAIYFHCQTSLVETFRALYPSTLRFEGNRSIVLEADEDLPTDALAHCIAMALTYHLSKRPAKPG
jgi:Domain of unknown function (DU1801)